MSQDTSPTIKPTVLRMSDLCSTSKKQGFLPVTAPTIWRWLKNGEFPEPFKLGGYTTVWHISDVESWIENQKKTTDKHPPRSTTPKSLSKE